MSHCIDDNSSLKGSTVLGIKEAVHCNYLRSWMTRQRPLIMDYLWTPYIWICEKHLIQCLIKDVY